MSSGSNSPPDFAEWYARGSSRHGPPPQGTPLGRLAQRPAEPVARPTRAGPLPPAVTVLMLLCQKIGSTGSGIVLKEMVDRSAVAGADFVVLCGGYAEDEPSRLFARQPRYLDCARFDAEPPEGFPFAIAGMSNRMPYRSVAFRELSVGQLETYVEVWSRRIRRLIDRFQPHVLHVHHLWLLAAVAAMESDGIPIVVSVHGTDLFRADDSPHLYDLVRPWASRIHAVLALTRESAAEVSSRYPTLQQRIRVFGNGYNPELFQVRPKDDRSWMEGFPWQDVAGRRVVLTVAKYDRRKGIEWLIRALARLAGQEQTRPLLIVAGSGPEAERDRYLRLAAELAVAEDMVLLGAVPYERVAALMQRADVFVLPAYREPFGLVILEALACGCPVVATDQAGPAEFVPAELRRRGDALLIPGLSCEEPLAAEADGFVERLAAAVSQQIGSPCGSDRRVAIAKTVEHLTWNGYVRRLGTLYRELLT